MYTLILMIFACFVVDSCHVNEISSTRFSPFADSSICLFPCFMGAESECGAILCLPAHKLASPFASIPRVICTSAPLYVHL